MIDTEIPNQDPDSAHLATGPWWQALGILAVMVAIILITPKKYRNIVAALVWMSPIFVWVGGKVVKAVTGS